MKKILFTLISFIFLFTGSFAQEYETEFQERTDELFTYIMNDYYCNTDAGVHGFQPCNSRPPGFYGIGSGDPFQYMGPKMTVIYEQEGNEGTYNSDLANERMTEHLTDFSLFHFNYPGLVTILKRYPDNPAVLETKEGWIQDMFDRTDSYSAFFGEGTENHLFMSRLPAYVLCELAVDSFPATFPQAAAMRDTLKNYIMTTSKRIYQGGVGEFNSTTYLGHSISGWLVLHDFANDEDVKAAARAVLDYYATSIALHYTQGTLSGTDLRGNRNTTSFQGTAAFLGWLWYGESPTPTVEFNTKAKESVYAALSSYRPPSVAVKIAKRELTVPAFYNNSNPRYLLDDPGYIKKNLYIDKNFTLGAGYLPYGGWSGGDWQTVTWKLISKTDPTNTNTAQFVSGTGMQPIDNKWYKFGNQIIPFDQYAQHENVLIQMTRVPDNSATIESTIQSLFTQWADDWDVDFAQRFSPTDTKYNVTGNPVNFQGIDVSTNQSHILILDLGTVNSTVNNNILFVELEKTYLAIRTIALTTPNDLSATSNTDNGTFLYSRDNAAKGSLCGFVMEVKNKDDYASFATFQNAVIDFTTLDKSEVGNNEITYTNLNGDVIVATYNTSGSFSEPIYDWGYGVTTKRSVQTEPPFTQPDWPSGEGYGRLASWSVNATPVDLNADWGLYTGPNVEVNNEMLVLNDSVGGTYTVDYTGEVPVFGGTLTVNEMELAPKSLLKLYPNPTNASFSIEGLTETSNVSIYSTSGMLLKKTKNSGEPISVSELTKGLYIVVTETDQGNMANKLLME